mgnify:CR=1 FL=1
MKLINGFALMEYAQKRRYILPAFNTTNLEMTRAIAKGLERAGLPGYIQISSSNLRLSDPQIIADIARDAVRNTTVPIGLHLDHGTSSEDVKACVEAGFTSIMVDASHLPFNQNVAQVRETVEYCHFYGIPVEAELGAIRGKEEDIDVDENAKTDPNMVEEFVRETGCDLLAVSIGNVHGLALQPHLDIPLLGAISQVCPVPLVLHGGSGIPADAIRKAKQFGLLKINYGSDLRHEYIRAFGEAYEKDHGAFQMLELCMRSVEYVSERVYTLTKMVNQ